MSKKNPEIYIRQLKYHEAKDKLIKELEKHYHNGSSSVRVIHGIGTYTLRKMVIEEIKTIDYVEIQPDFFGEDQASLLLRIFSPHIVDSF